MLSLLYVRKNEESKGLIFCIKQAFDFFLQTSIFAT
jgi:hypothetical protein